MDMEEYDKEDNLPVLVKESFHGKFEQDQYGAGYWEDENLDKGEDYTIKKDDSILIAGKIEQNFSSVEIYIYDHQNYSLRVHHDFMISAFPTALEWLGIQPQSVQDNGNDLFLLLTQRNCF
jgi:periodic tryptophan protein 1